MDLTALYLLGIGFFACGFFAFIWILYLIRLVSNEEEAEQRRLIERRRREEERRRKQDKKKQKSEEKDEMTDAIKDVARQMMQEGGLGDISDSDSSGDE